MRLARHLLRALFGSRLAPPAAPSALLEQAASQLARVTGASVRPYSTRDFGRAQHSQGRSVLVPAEDAESLLYALRPQLPPGTVAFVGIRNSLARPKPAGVELVVGEGASQFEMVRLAASDGINAGLSTDDIVRELQRWDRDYGIDIWQAETDAVQLKFTGALDNIDALAARVFAFCPDIVSQGTGSVDALAQELAEQRAILLWWD